MVRFVSLLTMSRTASHSTMNMSNADFDATVAKFAPTAYTHYTTNGDIKVWAREFARQFVHVYPGSTFLPVYYRLISFADSQMSKSEAVQKAEGTFPMKRTVNPSSATKSTSPSNTLSVDRGTLNRVLYRETRAWWNAFQLEGHDENPNAVDKFGDLIVGNERFIWHCAKVLARTEGANAEDMVPIVQQWLNSERSRNQSYFNALHHG
jgi:hypothetical protein